VNVVNPTETFHYTEGKPTCQVFSCLRRVQSLPLWLLPYPLSHNVEKQVVTVQLNGELREVPEGLTLAALIEWLKLPRDRVAVERNLEIVPRARWNVTPIQAGDQLEVVHLVGGGFSGWLETTAGRNA